MKRLLEELMLATTDAVLDQFASLPGAVVGKNYVYIEGTKPENERILLVGHADTVFSDPPKGINWNGNMATATGTEDKRELKAYPSRFAVPEKKEEKEPEVKAETPVAAPEPTPLPLLENAAETSDEKVEEVTGASREDVERIKREVTVTIGNQTMSLAEYEKARKEGKFVKAATTTYPAATNSYGKNRTGNAQRRTGSPAGLGADDRAGLAVLWALRKSGHSILVTDLEECGTIGAHEAAKEIGEQLKKHLFAVEVDRTGDQEMVFYDVGTREFEDWLMEKAGKGWRTGIGSNTDIKAICKVIGICGVNLAAGYWYAHSEKEMLFYDAWLRTYNFVARLTKLPADQLRRFELPKVVPAASTSQSSKGTGGNGQLGLLGPGAGSHSHGSSQGSSARGTDSGKGQTALEKEFAQSLLSERSLRSSESSGGGSTVGSFSAPPNDTRTSVFDLQDVVIDVAFKVTNDKESETLLIS